MIAGRLADPVWLWALAAAPLVATLWALAGRLRRRGLVRFAGEASAAGLARSVSPRRRAVKVTLTTLAAALIAAGLARPRVNPRTREAERVGRDVVFVVDVSRSMLARDLAPSRLERAKLWIKDLIAGLDGDRVGLVAFAGAASVQCPLTLDRSFLRQALDRLGPGAAPRGGTSIGDAIRKTIDNVFIIDEDDIGTDAPPARHRDIVLITDGEDQESFPVEAAQRAGQLGVRVIAIGIGSAGEGAAVPEGEDTSALLTYSGEVVRSRLDTGTLEAIAAASPGNVFLNVGTGTVDLEQVYRDLIGTAERTVTGTASVVEYDEFFWAFLGAAALLLAIEPAIGERRRA